MGDRGRGIPKICRCGEAVVMRTANTARNPGRLFHSCPHGREGVSYKNKGHRLFIFGSVLS